MWRLRQLFEWYSLDNNVESPKHYVFPNGVNKRTLQFVLGIVLTPSFTSISVCTSPCASRAPPLNRAKTQHWKRKEKNMSRWEKSSTKKNYTQTEIKKIKKGSIWTHGSMMFRWQKNGEEKGDMVESLVASVSLVQSLFGTNGAFQSGFDWEEGNWQDPENMVMMRGQTGPTDWEEF